MTSPAKRADPPSTPRGPDSDPFRLPGPVSAERLAQQSKRSLESPLVSQSKRKKRSKKNRKRRGLDSSLHGSDSPNDSQSDIAETPQRAESRLQLPILLTKTGTIRPLGDCRVTPCYECVRSVANESFAKYPHRCYDVKHETRSGVNSQCSTCARKHMSPCIPVRFVPRFISRARANLV